MLTIHLRKRLGRLLGLGLAGALMLGGADLPQRAYEGALVGLDPDTDNLFSAMGNMLPGESETGHFCIYNNGSGGGFFYLQAVNAWPKDTSDTQKQAESDRLLAALEMEVTLHKNGGSQPLYRGKANQVLNEGAETEFMMGATILLGYLAPGEELQLEATVKVPDWVDNSYDGTEGMFYWNFYSVQAETPRPPDPSEHDRGSSSSSSRPESPGTPDEPEPAPDEQERPTTLWKMPDATAVQPGGYVAYSMGGFANPLDETAYSLTVSDIVPGELQFVSAQLPAFTGGGEATYSIEYTTNLNGRQTLESGLPASQPYAVNAPALGVGERLTTLSVVFDAVPPGFGEADQIVLLFRLAEDAQDEGAILNRSMLFYTSGDGGSVKQEGMGRDIFAGGDGSGLGGGAGAQNIPMGATLALYGGQSTWALANLMLTIFSCLAAAVLFLYTLVKPLQQGLPHKRRQGGWETQRAPEAVARDNTAPPKGLWELPLLPYVASVLVCLFMLLYFFYVESILLTMVFVNWRTILFLLFAVLNLLLSLVCIRGGRKREPEAPQ